MVCQTRVVLFQDRESLFLNVSIVKKKHSNESESEIAWLQPKASQVFTVPLGAVFGIAHSGQHILFDDNPSIVTKSLELGFDGRKVHITLT